jgi:hypothetical protein
MTAEDSILSSLEAQTRRTKPFADGFRPAVPGERAPLGMESARTALSDDDNHPPRESRPSFKQMARRVQTINLLRKGSTNSSLHSRSSSHGETASWIAAAPAKAKQQLAAHRLAKSWLVSFAFAISPTGAKAIEVSLDRDAVHPPPTKNSLTVTESIVLY